MTRLLLAGAAVMTVIAIGTLAVAWSKTHGPAPVSRAAEHTVLEVTPDSIRAGLLASGFRSVHVVRARGPNFSVEAMTVNGLEARLVIHGGTGAILGIRILDETSGTRPLDTARR